MLRADASFARGVQNERMMLGPRDGKMKGASLSQAMPAITAVLRVQATRPYVLARSRPPPAATHRGRRLVASVAAMLGARSVEGPRPLKGSGLS